MKPSWLFLLLLVGGLAQARPAAAQTAEDSAAVLLSAARELRAEGQGSAADAVLRLLQRRFPGTRAALDAGQLLADARSAAEPVRPGNVELLVFSTTYGLWLGTAIPIMAEADGPEAYGAGLILGGPLGFLAARSYLKQRPITEGQARAITFGGTWGSWQGFGWTHVFDLGQEEECYTYEVDPTRPPQTDCYETDPSAQALVAGTVAGGLAGIATGAILARKPISSGVATTVSFGGLWGTWYGTALGSLADFESDDLLVSALLGGDAGLLAMAVLAPRWNPSRNRARLVSLGGVIGLLAGFGFDLIAIDDNEDLAIAIPTATSALGLLLASRATRDFDRRGGEDDGEGEFGGALLDYREGRLGMSVPAVGLKVERGARRRTLTSLYIPVLQARF